MKQESKYKSKKVIIDNIKFDSKKESKRYIQLKELLDNNEITNLQLQVKFELIPKQVDENGKCIERNCCYKADFTYYKDNQLIVEDTKGMKTPEYIIKRKLMLFKYGIRIKEI